MPDWEEVLGLWRAGRYYEVHEVLEPYWLKATGEERRLLQGVILWRRPSTRGAWAGRACAT